MQFSIIITYYTGLNILKTNLQLLNPTTIGQEAEIIIVNDNPSFPLEASEFDKLGVLVKIINLEKNSGYSVACNCGAKEASGENLIFMDCDIMPTTNWLLFIKKAMNETERCGAVSATILNMNTGGVVHWGMSMLHGVDVLKPFRDGSLPSSLQKGVHEFPLVTSGCLLVPREVFNRTGGFDPLLYNGYCDLDLIMKIRELEYHCVVSSEAVVFHRGKIAGQTRLASEEDTRALFVHRWGSKLPDNGMELFHKLLLSHDMCPEKGSALIINFCRSLFASEYYNELINTFSLNAVCEYDFRDKHEICTLLEDYLSWSMISIKTPILYFCDNYGRLVNNRHWFSYRIGRGDFIVDRHGNLMPIDALFKEIPGNPLAFKEPT